MSAASRLFAVYELIYTICKHVQIPEEDDEYWFVKPALPSLARVSRFVGSVALDVLWERQESLAPLFKVLPCLLRRRELRTAWEASDEDPDEFLDETYEILSMKAGRDGTRTIPPDQWERLQMYARRIKVLKDGGPIVRADRHHVSLNWHVMAAALCCCNGGVLLPNVHSLMLGEQMKAFLDAWPCFLPYVCRRRLADHVRLHSEDGTEPCRGRQPLSPRRAPIVRYHTRPQLGASCGIARARGPWARGAEFSKVGVESDLERCAAASAPSFQGLKTLRISDPFMLSCPTMILQNMSTEPLKLRELSITGWRFVESNPPKPSSYTAPFATHATLPRSLISPC
ncbi:hypothetical protein BD626DRAFT_206372 [Schizophyllum amplum]|uniref:Uncharacterized protein n=1 Tax=Schizophyllum amplum TaxID=97359 RepID=A0A550BZ67_9AGAR|nr:hypothetical protein BD626DRAFT_206372 [Auriculariopsis ampla]